MWTEAFFVDGFWADLFWPGDTDGDGSDDTGESDASSAGGGGVMVRTRNRPRRPSRDLATTLPISRTRSFTPVIRDTTSKASTPDLSSLLAAWTAFDDL